MNRIPYRLKHLRFIILRSKRQNSELTKYKRSTQNLPTQKELKTYIEEITRLKILFQRFQENICHAKKKIVGHI